MATGAEPEPELDLWLLANNRLQVSGAFRQLLLPPQLALKRANVIMDGGASNRLVESRPDGAGPDGSDGAYGPCRRKARERRQVLLAPPQARGARRTSCEDL
jgi:hypothetical protein